MKTYLCDRKIPNCADVVTFAIEAGHGAIAAQDAGELAYSVAWHRGVLRDDKYRRYPEPEAWALAMTDKAGART